MNPEWENVSGWVNQQPTLRWQVTDNRTPPAYSLDADPFPGPPPITIEELIATDITARIGPTCSVLVCWMTYQGFGDESWEDVAYRLGLSTKKDCDVVRRAVVRLILKFRWARTADGVILVTLPLRLAERAGVAS